MEKLYFLAKQYYGGDGPITLIFEKEEDRDKYLKLHDRCNEDGTATNEEIYDAGGNHWGVFVGRKNDKFYDEETGEEL